MSYYGVSYVIQVSYDWPGLPVGVKFDPSDAELLEHLAAKCSIGNSKPHSFIDEFIPTLVEDKGICYTHPENLPGKPHINSGLIPCFHSWQFIINYIKERINKFCLTLDTKSQKAN